MHKNKGRKLVISLKSSSVEISVVNITEVPELLFSKKETLLHPEKLDPSNFKSETLTALQQLIISNLNDITANLKGSHDAEIIFYSPWYLPEIISEQNKGEKVSLKKFFMEKVLPPQQNDYQQIENKITNISLNGYRITELKDIPSDDIQIDVFRSFVSKETLGQIKQILDEEIKQIKRLSFSTSLMQTYESIKELLVSEDNVTFAIISGEVTEIGIVQNDTLNYTATFPFGTHEFSRQLETFIGEKGNLSTLSFLSEKATDENLDQIKKDKIAKVTETWIAEFKSALADFNNQTPSKVLIFVNSDALDFVEMVLRENKAIEGMKFTPIKKDIFNEKVYDLETTTQKQVEYLLSTYYLSIKE
jgi:hypothetical protein